MGHSSHNYAHSYNGKYNGRAQRTNSKLRAAGRVISLLRLERLLSRAKSKDAIK